MRRSIACSVSMFVGLFLACGGDTQTDTGSTSTAGPGGNGTAGSGTAGSASAGKAGVAGIAGATAGKAGSTAGIAGASAGKAGSAAGVAGQGGGNGGIAGTSSVGGGAGTATFGGSAGAPVVCSAGNVCGPALCGNGVRDTCVTCNDPQGGPGPLGGGAPPPPPPPQGAGGWCSSSTETCDGGDLGGATCEGLGYASGAVVCNAVCGLDTSGCAACVTPGGDLASCGAGPAATGGPSDLSVVASGATLLFAWTDAAGAHAAEVDASLTVLSKVDLTPGATRIAATPLSGGWLVATTVSGTPTTTLTRLDGGTLSPTLVSTRAAYGAMFGERSDGPLFLYWGGVGIEMEVLDGAGAKVAGPKALTESIEPDYGNAIFDGTRFWVAQRASLGVKLFQVGLDATLEKTLDPAGSSSTEYPRVAAGDGQLFFTWNDFGKSPAAVNVLTMDAAGTPTGAPFVLGTTPAQFNVAPVVRLPGLTKVLLGGYTGGTGIGDTLDVVTPGGKSVAIARAPSMSRWHLVPFDGALIVAWLRLGCAGGIEVARVTP